MPRWSNDHITAAKKTNEPMFQIELRDIIWNPLEIVPSILLVHRMPSCDKRYILPFRNSLSSTLHSKWIMDMDNVTAAFHNKRPEARLPRRSIEIVFRPNRNADSTSTESTSREIL